MRRGRGKDRRSFDHAQSQGGAAVKFICLPQWVFNDFTWNSINKSFSIYWQRSFSLNFPAQCRNCQHKIVTFLLFLPGQHMFSYFHNMSFYTTDLDNHLQVCSWASGNGKLFLLKSFPQIGQREI